jgi:hypothetical protein
MASLAAVAVEALAKIVCKLKELRTVTSWRCNVADENRVEQGVPLEDMESFEMRNRLGTGQASGSTNDNPNSPTTTTSTESGTLTPGSDENLENQGMNIVQGVQYAR